MHCEMKAPIHWTGPGLLARCEGVRDRDARAVDLCTSGGEEVLVEYPSGQNMCWSAAVFDEFKNSGCAMTGLTSMTLNNFVTTVATPRKNVGLL